VALPCRGRHDHTDLHSGELTARIKIATTRQQAAVAAYARRCCGISRGGERLTNEGLLAQRLQFDQAALRDRTKAVRISRIQYIAGASDLLSVAAASGRSKSHRVA